MRITKEMGSEEKRERDLGLIEVSAPGKLMLFGEHAVIYGRPCIATAVDQRLNVSVGINSSTLFSVEAPEVGIPHYTKEMTDLGKGEIPKGVRFLETALKIFREKYGLSSGVNIKTHSEFSPEFGFGSSSAASVGILKALAEVSGISLSKRELFDLGYQVVRRVQGLGSGFDLAAAIWGGTIYFTAGGGVISPLNVAKLPLLVGYSGIKADTPTMVRMVEEIHRQRRSWTEKIFNTMERIVDEARIAIEVVHLEALGKLMNANQKLLASLEVSSPELDALIRASREEGAYGAKLSGAGGGDCMIALVPEERKKRVEEAIVKAGGRVLPVSINAEGVRRE